MPHSKMPVVFGSVTRLWRDGISYRKRIAVLCVPVAIPTTSVAIGGICPAVCVARTACMNMYQVSDVQVQ